MPVVYTSLHNVPLSLQPVLALGNFDGVHHGHLAVLHETAALARALGSVPGVLTFAPHPRQVLRPKEAPFQLMHPILQEEIFIAAGMEVVVRLPFDATMATTTANTFAAHLLAQQLNVRGVVCGYDFVFGHQRSGNTKFLEHLGDQHGFAVRIVPPHYGQDAHLYSSSAIRHALRSGQPEKAATFLGQAWTILGTVERGDQRGRTIGFPTANIDWTAFPYVDAKHGVYAATVSSDHGRSWKRGIANLGLRPTVGGRRLLLEVHCLEETGDLYDKMIRVRFHHFVREEQMFPSLETLKAQIKQDITIVEQTFLTKN
jgi:riboflavin kinase / FMN adenylyltransferase